MIDQYFDVSPLQGEELEVEETMDEVDAYNWVPSSNKNAVSIDRAKIVYKMFHGVSVDIGVMVYNQVLNFGVIQKEGEKKDTRWLIFPRTIYGVLQMQHMMQRKPRDKLVPVIPYKKDPRLGE
ncbi:hypothetical protein DY000_02048393 [Brassica cretica]|uniref:Uncharacterized protein n=1 Tax=Brassica cretica TaxID=69181 RepID=A0ABQ7ERH4_BRACR|nr:hypothetical protein DY000_02048393 [Brassica cretica]